MASYLKTLFEQDRFQRLRTRAHRRRFSLIQGAVTLGLIGLVPAVITQAEAGNWSAFWPLIGMLGGLFIAFLYSAGFLNASIAGVTEIPSRDLDEMQLRLRDEAMRVSYQVLGAVLLLCLSAPLVWHRAALPRVTVLSVALGAYLIYLATPAHVLAWRWPDEDESAVSRADLATNR
jgi:hypothetical protein